MGTAERFDRTEPWGTPLVPDEDSGIRVRPRTAVIAPIKQVKYTETAPLERPIRTAPLARPFTQSSPPPPVHVPMIHPSVHATVQAAVHASVHASVAAVLASAHTLRPPPPAPASKVEAPALAPAWTKLQRYYVLGTSVALAVITTLFAQAAMGGPELAATSGPRVARTATITSPVSAQGVGSAVRKDPAFVSAETASQPARRTPSVPAARPIAVAAGPAPTTPASSAKLDEAARSAKMLREQLSSAVD